MLEEIRKVGRENKLGENNRKRNGEVGKGERRKEQQVKEIGKELERERGGKKRCKRKQKDEKVNRKVTIKGEIGKDKKTRKENS